MATLKSGTTVGGSPVLTDALHNSTGNPHGQYKLTSELVAEYYNKVQTDGLLDLKVDLTQLPSLEQDKLDAEAAAAAAALSESNAAASASSSATSASQSATSATNANTSASNAATSEANAATSELNAAASETNAGLSQGYAEEWATKAEDSLISVAAGGNGTSDYSALHYAAKAATSASSASSSATSASNSATAASNSASAASASQAIAAVSETNALASANSSQDAATASLASAQDSEYWAGVAQSAASNEAIDINYNNTTSGLTATNVQAAIDEVSSISSVTSVDLSVPTGFSVSGNPITSAGTLAVSFEPGYSLLTDAQQGSWFSRSGDTIDDVTLTEYTEATGYSASGTIDRSIGAWQKLALFGPTTLNVTGLAAGQCVTITVLNGNTYGLSYTGVSRWSGNGMPSTLKVKHDLQFSHNGVEIVAFDLGGTD